MASYVRYISLNLIKQNSATETSIRGVILLRLIKFDGNQSLRCAIAAPWRSLTPPGAVEEVPEQLRRSRALYYLEHGLNYGG